MEVLLLVLTTGVVSAGVAAALTALWCGRTAAHLRARLDKVEQARAAAHARSLQARSQIQQLSQAIAELQRRHRSVIDQKERRAELDRLVPSDTAPAGAATHGFVDTQPL